MFALDLIAPALAAMLGQQEAPVRPPAEAATTLPSQPVSDDIVVVGLKDLDDPDSAVTRRTLGSGRTGRGARESRSTWNQSTRWAVCAVRRSPQSLRWMRGVLDGRTNSSAQAFAQGRLIQMNATCLQSPRAGAAALSRFYDASYYDRGALTIEAIKAFAPDLTLTAEQTGDPVVQRRFDARELPLAAFRLPVDRRYFETAVCVVRLQPRLAVALVRADDPDAIARLEASMVNRARACVGGARKVYFDPTQFRFYIADAVYRWAVAARGATTLVPDA